MAACRRVADGCNIEGADLGRQTTFGVLLSACIFAAPEASAEADETSQHTAVQDEISIEHAEIVLAPRGSKMAGYLTIWNGTQNPIDLAKVESDAFQSISLHNTEIVDGVARMRPLDGIPIPGHAELVMQREGIHMMLDGSKTELEPGEAIDLVLTFHDGTQVSIAATILPTGAKPIHHDHGEDD